MRKNRKRTRRMSVTATRTMHLAAVIMMLFVMVIVNLLAGSRCDQMLKSIGEKENLLAKLEKDRERESGRWDQVNKDENLDNILSRLAMPMKYPRPEQVVHMDASGQPERGQISVARAARRRSAAQGVVVQNSKSKSTATRQRR